MYIFLVLSLIVVIPVLLFFIAKGFNKNQSSMLMFFLGIFLFITEASFRNRDLDDSTVDFQILLRLAVWFGFAACSFIYYKKVVSFLINSNARYLTFYCLFCLISTVYSPIPVYTGVNALVQLCFLVFAVTVAVNLSLLQICLAIFYMSISFHTISILLVPLFPELTVMEFWGQGEIGGQRITGLSGSANGYGQMAGLAIIVTHYLRKSQALDKKKYLIAMLFFVFCLLASWSRTSIFITIIGLYLIDNSLFQRYKHYVYVSIPFAIVSYFIVFDLDDLMLKLSRNGSIEEIFTFTGRTDIWDAVWHEAIYSPIWGYGYASTKLLLPQIFETDWGWSTVTAHSMFFQALFTTGLIGVSLFMVTLIVFFKVCRRLNNGLLHYMFFLVVVNGLLESGAIGPIPNKLTFIYFLFFTVSLKIFSNRH